jgi:hypothetical protein
MIDNRGVVAPEDALAIAANIVEFAYLVDHGRATECERLFADDAKLTFGPGSPKPGTLDGIEAIKGFLAFRQAQTQVTTRHVMTNFRFMLADDGRISAYSLLTLFRSEDESRQPNVTFVADIDEIYSRQEDGKWRVQERLITPVFSRTN